MSALLLCELHAHTTWSDGWLPLADLVDLYGRHRFDVLCVTDHTVRLDDPCPTAVDSWVWPAYLDAVEREAARAREEYDLLLVPGLELTDNRDDPELTAHALALGLRSFVSVEDGFVDALRAARSHGAALVAAHPFSPRDEVARPTLRFWRERELLAPLVHRFELFNRDRLFGWVAEEQLPPVATGDFHRTEDLASWKTLVPCAKDERSLVEYLRSPRPVYLAPFLLEQRDGDRSCVACGYGVSSPMQSLRCPMCGAHDWRPLRPRHADAA